jgi:hypothetical protein
MTERDDQNVHEDIIVDTQEDIIPNVEDPDMFEEKKGGEKIATGEDLDHIRTYDSLEDIDDEILSDAFTIEEEDVLIAPDKSVPE